MITIGLMLVASGVGLIMFSDVHLKNGVQGIFLITGLIGAGLFLLLPAKIYLTLQMMKNNDKKAEVNK
jgi:hypothetical protein